MLNSEFSLIKNSTNFRDGLKGALSLIICEIIDWYTEKDVNLDYIRSIESGNQEQIDQWDFMRVQFAYSLKGADGSLNKYTDDLRPLFLSNQESPFTIIDGKCNSDEVEVELYTRISAAGFFNYWAGAKPEHKGKFFDGNTWS